MRLNHRDQHQLSQAFADHDIEIGLTTIPARHHQRALVIGVDQTDQITQHDAVFMTQAGARQNQRGQARVADVNRQAGRDQQGFARLDDGVFFQHGAQVEAGGAGRGVLRQREFGTDAGVEDLGLQSVHVN
ncbi:hypothetical protein PS685_05059 [Pseudomonas fluorescens]|uniref:Uncharacterized protein n=1 Tax=Pseudomonas fluorescens TaxID=294 RepID=A0A5E7A3N4_PSEFL|nr:hypothetical protein PS685_05059 [Pseudomonas fluorescens]